MSPARDFDSEVGASVVLVRDTGVVMRAIAQDAGASQGVPLEEYCNRLLLRSRVGTGDSTCCLRDSKGVLIYRRHSHESYYGNDVMMTSLVLIQ
jgi:hypothetical protein